MNVSVYTLLMNYITRRSWTRALLILAVLCYIASLASPAIMTDNDGAWYGYLVLLLGWQGIFAGMFAWIANLLFIIGLGFCLLKMNKIARISVICAFIVSLQSFYFTSYPAYYGGTSTVEVYLSYGFYLWLSSFALLLIATIIAPRDQVSKI